MKYLIFLFLSTISFSGCVVNKKNYYAKPSKGIIQINELLLEGNYIGQVSNSDKRLTLIFSFYKNGIVLENNLDTNNFFFDSSTNSESYKKIIISQISYRDSIFKGIKQAGGLKIEGDKIIIQVFEFVNYGSFEVTTYSGNIIGNTKIRITSCYIKSNSNFCPSEFELNYVPMDRPDSTNQWMKKKWYWKN